MKLVERSHNNSNINNNNKYNNNNNNCNNSKIIIILNHTGSINYMCVLSDILKQNACFSTDCKDRIAYIFQIYICMHFWLGFLWFTVAGRRRWRWLNSRRRSRRSFSCRENHLLFSFIHEKNYMKNTKSPGIVWCKTTHQRDYIVCWWIRVCVYVLCVYMHNITSRYVHHFNRSGTFLVIMVWNSSKSTLFEPVVSAREIISFSSSYQH